MAEKTEVQGIILLLEKEYPEVSCTIHYDNPFQLLVAVQLSAQCTDERVNLITRSLFRDYVTLEDWVSMDLETLIGYVRSAGFYNHKSRNILKCARMISGRFGGIIPDNMEDLLTLPGLGRKSANILLGELYGIPGVIVDTHAKRLSMRMGLTRQSEPERIEKDLMQIIPKDQWTGFSHRLVFHGRKICKARRPLCGECTLSCYCRYGKKDKEKGMP